MRLLVESVYISKELMQTKVEPSNKIRWFSIKGVLIFCVRKLGQGSQKNVVWFSKAVFDVRSRTMLWFWPRKSVIENNENHKVKKEFGYRDIRKSDNTLFTRLTDIVAAHLRSVGTTDTCWKDIQRLAMNYKFTFLPCKHSFINIRNVHVKWSVDIRITPVNWPRLERNRYGVNRYSRSSLVLYSRKVLYL